MQHNVAYMRFIVKFTLCKKKKRKHDAVRQFNIEKLEVYLE